MTQTPLLTGQDIGQVHKATRAVLERRLAASGTEFNAWVMLNVLGSSGLALAEDDLVRRTVHGLKIDVSVARDILTQLLAHGLIERTSVETAEAQPTQIALTAAGIDRFHQVRAAIGEISERLYGGLPADELAIAHRMLAAVTARANAELAS